MPDYRILGPLEASDEAGPLVLGGWEQRVVIAHLLVEPSRAVSIDRLFDAAWPEASPRAALTSLQLVLSEIRTLLGPHLLETKAPGYRLRVRPWELDLDRFKTAVQAARDSAPQQRSQRLRHALALWRGPPLADFASEPFARPYIAYLEELRLKTLEDRIQADLDCARHDELVGELECFVEEHPEREVFRREYELALRHERRRPDAL